MVKKNKTEKKIQIEENEQCPSEQGLYKDTIYSVSSTAKAVCMYVSSQRIYVDG